MESKIDFSAVATTVNETVENKAVVKKALVSNEFIDNIISALSHKPKRVEMHFKQSPERKLEISMLIFYKNGVKQMIKEAGNCKLISLIQKAILSINENTVELNELEKYKQEEKEIEIAAEGEDLNLELFKQYISSGLHFYIDNDWLNVSTRALVRNTLDFGIFQDS